MEVKPKILVIEDEELICDILAYALRKEGYSVKCAFNGRDGIKHLESYQPDLVLLDIMLPDTSGFEVCKAIMERRSLPILMLTARDDIVDKILGLELGADDYITKPFDIREVAARVKVALRRQPVSQATSIVINGLLRVDPHSHIIYKEDTEIRLKPKEYELLLLFARNKNKVFSREEVLDRVWDMDYEGDIRTVDVHIQRLRKKLDDPRQPFIIETVFGVGYKMKGR